MAEVFNEIWATVEAMWSVPVIRFLVSFVLAFLPLQVLFRSFSSILYSDFHVDCSGLFQWIYDRIIDLLKKLFGFEFIYKHGLARPGVDYVECDSCFCSECTFRDQCPVERRAEMAALKGEDLSDG